MQQGYSPLYLRIVDPTSQSRDAKDTEGVACINIDHKCIEEQRAYIRHLSVRDKQRFEEALTLVLDFIWKNIACRSIRLNQHHFRQIVKDQSKLQADAELGKILSMNKKGFKWKSL